MDLMDVRREMMGVIVGMAGIRVIEETITVPSNSISRMDGVAQFIKNATQADVLLEATIVETPTTNNQFYSYVYDLQSFYIKARRLRDGNTQEFNWLNNLSEFAGNIVEGTHYNVKYIKL